MTLSSQQLRFGPQKWYLGSQQRTNTDHLVVNSEYKVYVTLESKSH